MTTNSLHVPACGGVYLLHASHAIGTSGRGTAQHYLGDSPVNMRARFLRHKKSNGSALTRAMRRDKAVLSVVRIWPGANKKFADRMKRAGLVGRLCPVCNPERWFTYAHTLRPGETIDGLPFETDFRKGWPNAFYIETQFRRFFAEYPSQERKDIQQRILFPAL
jgi:hypothetical protein